MSRELREYDDYVKRYFDGRKKAVVEKDKYDHLFFRHILDMPHTPFSVKLKIFARFFELAEERKGTTDFRFLSATSAIYDVLSEEKFI